MYISSITCHVLMDRLKVRLHFILLSYTSHILLLFFIFSWHSPHVQNKIPAKYRVHYLYYLLIIMWCLSLIRYTFYNHSIEIICKILVLPPTRNREKNVLTGGPHHGHRPASPLSWEGMFHLHPTSMAITAFTLGVGGASPPLPSDAFHSRLSHRDAQSPCPHRARLLSWIEAPHHCRRDVHWPLPPSTSPSTPCGSRSLHGSPSPRSLLRLTSPMKDVWLCLLPWISFPHGRVALPPP
jgi:hypothetical protein